MADRCPAHGWPIPCRYCESYDQATVILTAALKNARRLDHAKLHERDIITINVAMSQMRQQTEKQAAEIEKLERDRHDLRRQTGALMVQLDNLRDREPDEVAP